jgi:thiol-disulfide isomerase/thioredoxin
MPVLFLCIGHAVAQKSQTITAKFSNIGNHTVKLSYSASGVKVTDSAKAGKDGVVRFSYKMDKPVVASLSIADPELLLYIDSFSYDPPALEMFIGEGPVLITGQAKKFFKATVKGGKANEDWSKIRPSFANLSDTLWTEFKKTYEKKPNAKTEEDVWIMQRRIMAARIDLQKGFIQKNSESLLAAYFLSKIAADLEPEQLGLKYDGLGSVAKQSVYGKSVGDLVNGVRTTATGMKAVELKKKDMNGNPVSIESLRGKLVLLDFWGSWCGPCRASHPHLKEMYEKYKGKGFEIIGIAQEKDGSLEEAEKQWKQAITEDGIPWVQVLNNVDMGKYNIVKAYAITAFPSKILIDKEGKIIGRYVGKETADLDKILAEMLPD